MMENSRSKWSTPQCLFDVLDREFKFTLDAAASEENAKCDKFYTREQDSMSIEWRDERVFLNPPYSRKSIESYGVEGWLAKAHVSASQHGSLVVVLTPGDCSTGWFAKYAELASEVRLLNPRVKFVPPPGVKESSPEKGNALFVFRPGAEMALESDGDVKIWLWRWEEEVVLSGA